MHSMFSMVVQLRILSHMITSTHVTIIIINLKCEFKN